MPHIVIYNLAPSDFKKERILKIERAIEKAILDISELELTYIDIGYSFLQDPTITSDAISVVIIVELLFDKPKRTFKVRQRLAQKIGEAFKSAVKWRNLPKLEVAVKRFNPEKDGFYSG